VHPRNPHDPTPVLRALLVALDQWVTEGVEPPASRVPTLAAGILVAPKDLQFPAIPEVQAPGFANGVDVLTDWVHPESSSARAYTPQVPQVDGDGNEIAGIRLPAIAVPLATHTGWNLYKTPYPEGELCDREGSYLPFARTTAERLAKGDPRPSLEERYGNHEAYTQRVKDAVRELLEARLLLADDAVRFVDDAVGGNLFKP
jgi:Alpha/beta hydrolase domain